MSNAPGLAHKQAEHGAPISRPQPSELWRVSATPLRTNYLPDGGACARRTRALPVGPRAGDLRLPLDDCPERLQQLAPLNANGGHVATVINLHSRALVCWSAADHMRTSLITDALDVGITHFSSVATGSTPNSTFFSSMNFTIDAVGG